MRGDRIFVVLVLAAVLIFGCASPSAPPQGANNTTAPAGGGGAPSETGGTAGGGAGTAEEGTGTPGAAGGNGATTGGSGTDDLSGKSYEVLAGMGVPMQCDITVTGTNYTYTAKDYMKGSSEVRSEATQAGSPSCTKVVTIMKDDKLYMGCASGEVMEGCDWLEFSTSETSGGETSGYSEPDYESVPPEKISCQPWVYDASKFTASGTICNFDDIMKGYQQGYGDYGEYD